MIKNVLQNMNNRFKIFLSLTVLYALFIFYLSSSSNPAGNGIIFGFLESCLKVFKSLEDSGLRFLLYPLFVLSLYPDKAGHIVLYAGFGFLLYLTLKNSSHPAFRKNAMVFTLVAGILYGAFDEFHQFFVPGRTVSIIDLFSNVIGLLITSVIVFINGRLDSIPKKKSVKNKEPVITFDLYLIAILIFLSMLFTLVPPFNQTFLRMVLASPLLLFLPGYLLMSVMFPKRKEISPVERFTLSIGLSIAITVFDGFALNNTSWGFRPDSIVFTLSLLTGILLVLSYFQRLRFVETYYSFSVEDLRSFYQTLKSKETLSGPEYDTDLEKTLIKIMVIALILVSAMLVYAKVTTEPEKFTTLYIIGASGKAEDYPDEVIIGEPTSILVGVENYEHEKVDYTLLVMLEGTILKKEDIVLGYEGKWLNEVTFIPRMTSSIVFAGANRSKLEFQLLKDNKSYRSVHLLVKTNLDLVKFAELPEIINGDMESVDGWQFSGSPTITGNYIDNLISSKVYEIKFAAENQGSYGAISQNLTTFGEAPAILSFDVRDSEYSNKSNYVFKQALVDGKVIWESGAGGGNSSWEHVEIPVLLSGKNNLSLRVYSKYTIDYNVTVWWDNVLLEYLGSLTEYNSIRRPSRKEIHEFNFDVRGAPLPVENSMTITGFSFPGFKYNFSGNMSFEELNMKLSNGTQIDTGNATYISRVNGSEIYLMGSRYRLLDNDIPINLSRVLDIDSSKTLALNEVWTFGDGYSLSINLISLTGDSVMFELKKGGKRLDSKLVNKRRTYEYKTKVGKLPVTVFRAKVDSISGDKVYLTNIELFSESITQLSHKSTLGDFKVNSIGPGEIVFKNVYAIELKDKALILNGSVGLTIQGDKLYPYASGVEIRGTPQNINRGSWMNITAFNYPGFYLNNDTSYEELNMYFSGNGLVEKGEAVYTARNYLSVLSFLGNTYELTDTYRPGYISNIKTNEKIIFNENETREVDGYIFSFKKVDNQSIMISIKKSLTKNQTKLLNESIKSNVTFFPDVYYEIFTGKSGNLKKSNILSTGETFEYWIEYREDKNYKAIAGVMEAFNGSNIELNIEEYEIPFEMFPGKSYGDFEVDIVTRDSIILKNTKALQFEPGKEKEILNGTMKIKTFPDGYLAYPSR